jgi:hypothetical protein
MRFFRAHLPHKLLSRSRSSSHLPPELPDPKIKEENDTRLTGASAAAPGATQGSNKAVGLSNHDGNDMWTIAEKELRQDPEKCKVLEKYDRHSCRSFRDETEGDWNTGEAETISRPS